MQTAKTKEAAGHEVPLRVSSHSGQGRSENNERNTGRQQKHQAHHYFGSTGFPTLNLKLAWKTLFDFEFGDPQVMHHICSFLYPILSTHSEFKDKDWSKNSTLQEVSQHLISELNRLFREPRIRIRTDDSDELSLSFYYECNASQDYGRLISVCFLEKMEKSDKPLFKLMQRFFSFCWYDLDVNTKEAEITTYRKAFQYASDIKNIRIKKSTLKRYLSTFYPTEEVLINLKEWMIEGLHLSKDSECFRNFLYNEDNNPYNDGELHPWRYLRFVWDDRDNMFEQVCFYIDDIANNIGIQPLVTVHEISKAPTSWDDIKPSPWPYEFVQWLDRGMGILDKVNSYYNDKS